MSNEELAAQLQAALGEAYKVEKPLGEGGFAVVYLVRDLNLKRRLAVKVLSPDLITSRTVLDRFRREAETVAQLSHPHIVPLHFIGQKDDLLYLVMECIDGGSLADRIEKGRMPPAEVGRILREVASALDYAHKRGVIHRDIKPHNVLIEAETGRSLVTDFGIARTAEGGSLTATGMLVGTPAYLSPEQVAGEGGDHRADIYALGIVAYEMLTGQPPFTGPTPTAVLMKRLGEPPPPLAKVRPDAPELLRDVIEGMLASDPAQRFQSAGRRGPRARRPPPMSGRSRHRRAPAQGQGSASGTGACRLPCAGLVVAGIVTAALMLAPQARGGRRRTGRSGHGRRSPEAPTPSAATRDRRCPVPRTPVTVEPFGIDTREVTVGEYAGVRRDRTGHRPLDHAAGQPSPGHRSLLLRGDELLRLAPRALRAAPEGGGMGGRGSRAGRQRRFPWGNAWDPAAANTQSARRCAPPRWKQFSRRQDQGGRARPGGKRLGVDHDADGALSRRAPPSRRAAAGRYYVIRGGAFNTPDSAASTTLRGYAIRPLPGQPRSTRPVFAASCRYGYPSSAESAPACTPRRGP